MSTISMARPAPQNAVMNAEALTDGTVLLHRNQRQWLTICVGGLE
jgi:hypothetical protein